MPKLIMGQKLILQAILKAQGESADYIEDTRIAELTDVPLRDVRNYYLTLDQAELVDLALGGAGLKAAINPTGRLALGLFAPFPAAAAPEPIRTRAKARTGREQALVIGISDYQSPIPKLPAVANDVREMAALLGSEKGQFPAQNVLRLTDAEATCNKVIEAIETTFAKVETDSPVFAYMAGHGSVVGGEYYFVAQDTSVKDIRKTGVPLSRIKEAFDASPSQQAFLWLDFCHSGGILARDVAVGGQVTAEPDDRQVLSRSLEVMQGQGKLIVAACSPSQSAWESANVGHGLFTEALLKGLKGEAANQGEVTINSLFDYIDKRMGSDRQRPMMFGQMTGRVILTRT